MRLLRAVIAASLMAVPAAALLGGCHVSAKAPAHVFSATEARDLALPIRLRNGPEHDAVRARAGEPYVLEYSGERGALHYYGGRHSQNRDDPQLDEIRQRWATFRPTVALCEGRQSRHFWGFLVEPFAGLPEPTLVHALARRDDVLLVSLEPDYVDEVRALNREFSAHHVALYFFLRVYASEAGGDAKESLARDLLAKRTDVDGLRGTLETLEDVDRAWNEAQPGGGDWRLLSEEPRVGILAEISDASRRVRGEHMVRVIADLVRKGERVFAVVGSGHVIRQEWALRALLGMSQTDDAPEAEAR